MAPNPQRNTSSGSLVSSGQIRLAEISVFNWGSFNGLHTAKIDPLGTLLTGDNGSGKSTFIDGLMALLLPAGKASFNVAAAQGDRSDRTLLSYMRGSFGSAHDGSGTRVKSKREAAVVTGLRALYQGDDGSQITLAALFWTTQASNALADVKRIYAIAKRNLTLKEMLDAFGEANARSLKQWMRSDAAITCCDERFGDYQELYRKLLFMDNKNAPALLSRALGLKKIDDLTALIRELVLEPSTVKEDARKVVSEFADLVAIHQKLTDARAQQAHLSRLPDFSAAIHNATAALDGLSAERDGLNIYFGEIGAHLWGEKIATYQLLAKKQALDLKQCKAQERDTKDSVERRHAEYLQFGGDRIESLKKDVVHAQASLQRVISASSRYQEDAKKLALSNKLLEGEFNQNQSAVAASLENIAAETEASQNHFAELAAEYSKLRKKQTEISTEIREIEARPDSNINIRFQQLRDELIESLGLKKDDCVFIGELIDVADQQRDWQGAIERALGGLPTTLAVPGERYPMVTRWLNARHTGLHVRVQVVEQQQLDKKQPAIFNDRGYLRKLVWREHPYRDWLKRHLARFDLHCVSSTEELDQTPFSMTRQGLMQKESGRFEKKDLHRIDDRRNWNLGFSNKSRLAILNQDRKELLQQHKTAEIQVAKARQTLDELSQRKSLLQKFQSYRWDEINAPYWQHRVSSLKADLLAQESSSDDLEKAKTRWEAAKVKLSEVETKKEALIKKEGQLSKMLADAKKYQQQASEAAAPGLNDSVRTALTERTGELTTDDLPHGINQQKSMHAQTIERSLESWRGRKNSAEKSAIGIMSSFRSHEKWQIFTLDWRSDISSLNDYIEHLRQLEEEGLPNLVEQFIERLNKHATQSLARIKTKLESEREDIIERIDTINRVLKRTEFKPGSHLKLGTRKDHYPHVQDFERQLRKVLSQVTSEDHEARYVQLVKVVNILDKASSSATFGTLESLRLLDPRFQMSFYAEELDRDTGEVRDVLESSSGKSGGEKESFAGTIVAASLAYVLTPDGYDRPVYCTVFLDEAFSNTAEAVSRRVLSVFKELKIHVNLITPYKNLNLARESARSLLIAERDPEQHASHLCEVTWEEIDRRMATTRQQKLAQEARTPDIELQSKFLN